MEVLDESIRRPEILHARLAERACDQSPRSIGRRMFFWRVNGKEAGADGNVGAKGAGKSGRGRGLDSPLVAEPLKTCLQILAFQILPNSALPLFADVHILPIVFGALGGSTDGGNVIFGAVPGHAYPIPGVFHGVEISVQPLKVFLQETWPLPGDDP